MIIQQQQVKKISKINDDAQNIALARLYGTYLLAVIWEGWDIGTILTKQVMVDEERFSIDNPFRHLYRREKGLGCYETPG